MGAAVLAALTLVCGCTSDPAPPRAGAQLVVPVQPFGMSLPSGGPGVPTSIGSITLCLDSPGEVVIDSVEPLDASGGLQVSAFAVREHVGGDFLGAEETTLEEAGFGGDATVDQVCGAGGATDELGVEFRVPGAETGRSSGLRVGWHEGRTTQSSQIPLTFVLCKDQRTAEGDCAP